MPRSRFVRPDTAILKLSDGDTLTVKRRLTSGEQRAAFDRACVVGDDGMSRFAAQKSWTALILAYLLDWTFCDEHGTRVVIAGQPESAVLSAIDALDMESFLEIKEAIEAHETVMLAEREQTKNGLGDENRSPAISPSPDGAAGAMSGSPS